MRGGRRPVAGWWRVTGLPPLGGAEGIGGGQAGGTDRRVQPRHRAQAQRGGDPAGHPREGDDDLPVLLGGVAGGDQRAQHHPAGAAQQRQQQRLDHELGADVALGGAQGAAQADLGAALQHADDHDVGDADPTDQQRHPAKPQQQRVERALGGGLGGQRVGGAGDLDLVGVLGVGGGRQHPLHPGDLVGVGAHVDGAGRAVVAEQRLGGGEADQRGPVQLGRQRHRRQDADHGEPAAPEPHLAAGLVDAQLGRGGRAEHGGGGGGGGGGGPGALGRGGPPPLREFEVGGGDADPAGLLGGDVVVAVDGGVRDGGDG